MPEAKRIIHYIFQFAYDDKLDFYLQLDEETLDVVQEPQESPPEWTKLGCQKCTNCPLDEKTHPHCPVALSLVEPLTHFSQKPSTEHVRVSIDAPERTYIKETDYPSALVSLLGMHAATSGCPIMDKLRPTVRFHIPFATKLDTTYRSIANYLIAQFLLTHQEKTPDWECTNFDKLCEDIATVNQGLKERLKEIKGDNYVRDCFINQKPFSNDIDMAVDNEVIEEIRGLFQENANQKDMTPLTYEYQFSFGDNETKNFTMTIDRNTLTYVNRQESGFPDWTQLENNKCENCPLEKSEHNHCPTAAAISETIEFFRKTLSIEEGMITIKSANRDYLRSATISDGISAMIGLVMASSGCPILSQLKPLVYSHLPFGTQEETAYRSLGMYFVSQYLLDKSGQKPDWDLKNLTKLYEEINTVNKAFCVRLRESRIEDASLNALVKLDCFAHIINFELSKGKIEKLQKLFVQYTES